MFSKKQIDHPAIAELAALKIKVAELIALNQKAFGWSSAPADITIAISQTMETLANAKAETNTLALLDGTFASFAGLPTTAEGVRGAIFAHVRGSAHVQGTLRAENTHLGIVVQNLREQHTQAQAAIAALQKQLAEGAKATSSVAEANVIAINAMAANIQAGAVGDTVTIGIQEAELRGKDEVIATRKDARAEAMEVVKLVRKAAEPPQQPKPQRRQPQNPGQPKTP